MDSEKFTNVRSLLTALAASLNLINPDVEHHHEQTAYLSFMIGNTLELDVEDIHLLVYAALLHDVGSIIVEEQKSIMEIEREARKISKIGAYIIRETEGFEDIADVVEYCQHRWIEIENIYENSDERIKTKLRLASIIHLADTVSLLITPKKSIINQLDHLSDIVYNGKNTEFAECAVDAFMKLKQYEFVWLDLVKNPSFLLFFTGEMHTISLEETARLTSFMSHLIDFKSPFTAMHSAGVAAAAKKLAEFSGMSRDECIMMEIAGYLHDIGKLNVPRSILEKPGKLDDEEFNIVKEHAYYTRLILMNVEGFEKIADWAGFHHEKLNGLGYPFHYDAPRLDKGSRIMAVADIFSAITEERPYRKGMNKEQAIEVLKGDVERGEIDPDIVKLLIDNYEAVDMERDKFSKLAGQRYFKSLSGTSHN